MRRYLHTTKQQRGQLNSRIELPPFCLSDANQRGRVAIQFPDLLCRVTSPLQTRVLAGRPY